MLSTGKKLVYTVVMPTAIKGFREMEMGTNMLDILVHISSIEEKESNFRELHVTMPKFKLDFDYDRLKEHLIDLGILSFNL